MSNYYLENAKCPKCGNTQIEARDNTPTHHQYTYVCNKEDGGCGFKSQNSKDFEERI